jgi:hypothetical protein
VTSDPITGIAVTLHHVRPDWSTDDITDLFQTTHIPRETLLRALATGCRATDPGGACLLTRPHDVLSGAWLTVAQADIDQLNAEDRDQHARDDSPGEERN